ncbi:MAG: redoxin domain-containing protein [Pirellulales bacterium]
MQATWKTSIAVALWSIGAMVASAEEAVSKAAADAPAKIGQQVADFTFKDIRYLPRELADFGEKKAYVLAFTTLDCPIVQRYLPKLVALEKEYGAQGVQFLAVNEAPGDAIREIAYQAVKTDAPFPFVKDMDGQVAKAVGATRAGEVVVLDGQKKLRYRGRIDRQFRLGGENSDAGREDLKLAIDDVLAGRDVAVSETAVDGCKLTLSPGSGVGGKVTFHEHVVPLLQKHCQDCHHAGAPEAPFALVTYEDVANQAEMIAEVVAEQRMPPWYGSEEHGHFTNVRGMTADERATLVSWANNGREAGDSAKAPPARVFSEAKWKIGTPDLVLETAVQKIPASGYIDYRYLPLQHAFTEDTWIQGAQILPENLKAMHHCNMFFVQFGKRPNDQNFITGQVPGGDAFVLDRNVAFKIPAGTILMLQVHYVTLGTETTDKISVGLKFAREVVQKNLKHTLVHTGKFAITPGDPHHPVKAQAKLDCNATGYGMMTHMHVRGKDMTYKAIYPDGKDEMLLAIPNYNFDWQMAYRWPVEQIKFPKGTTLECIAHYDNSTFNPYNPDPKDTVKEGQQTFQEMMYGFVFYTDDDENLNLKIDPQTGHVIKTSGDQQASK